LYPESTSCQVISNKKNIFYLTKLILYVQL